MSEAGFDDSAHVVVERHPDAERRHAFGELRHFPAVSGPVGVREFRALGDRREAVAAGGVGIDHDLATEIAQQRQVRFDRGEFLGDAAFEDAAVEPAGDELQLVACENRAELGGACEEICRQAPCRCSQPGGSRRGRFRAGCRRRVPACRRWSR